MKNLYTLFCYTVIFLSLLEAQSDPPKREFRAAWVATVTNIDWPSSKSLSTSAQKAEAITILDKHQANNMNAILLQVRPSCDAFYLNGLEPLSEWLVGAQGGNFSGSSYDPLQFWIDEAHKRGMELHVWINPYRSVHSASSSIHSTHISKTQPSWNINYGGSPYKFLDPGLPQVREYVIKVVMDIVRRYNIDGVHYDDYFYPYGGMTNQDSVSWAAYGGGWGDKGDWRRNNVNTFVAHLHDSIKSVKPWVKYGVSPFGIWKSGIPSGISGLSAYSQIYCDAVNWITNKKIDYLTPQLYWRINNGVTGPNGAAQDYNNLMPWWSGQLKPSNRHLYVGHAAHNLALNASAPYPRSDWPAQEIQDQVASNRINNRAQGSVLFSSKSVTNNLKGIQDSLRNNQFKYKSIPPAMPWLDSIPPLSPTNLTATIASNSVTLQWQKPAKALDNDTAQYFVIYRVQSPDTININKVKQIILITKNDTTKYVDNAVINGQTYTYAVASFDKLDNESSTYASLNLTVTGVENLLAAPQVFSLAQNYPNPFNPTTTFSFTLPGSERTTLQIYDLLGREVATVVDEVLDAGTHSYQFSGASLASGIYIYRLVSGLHTVSKKMILQK